MSEHPQPAVANASTQRIQGASLIPDNTCLIDRHVTVICNPCQWWLDSTTAPKELGQRSYDSVTTDVTGDETYAPSNSGTHERDSGRTMKREEVEG